MGVWLGLWLGWYMAQKKHPKLIECFDRFGFWVLCFDLLNQIVNPIFESEVML